MMRRTGVCRWIPFMNVNLTGVFRLPGDGSCNTTADEMRNIKFFETKSRQQWDYQGIDERINSQSAFRDMSQREDFNGPRTDHTITNKATFDSNQPGYKQLWEYFDEYTQPGSDKKHMAAVAVKEQWDAAEPYYPGEQWRRNRPSFRSVPQELLNRQTWYHWIDLFLNMNDLAVTYRNRMFNPQWPPPGYKQPKFETERKFVFGTEDPGLVTEIERWWWFKNWFENNQRNGPWEWLGYFMFATLYWIVVRSQHSNTKFRAMLANMYYPGRQIILSFGEPRDWATERWWWQEPLETWPNQGEIWWMGESRWKYINLKKKEDAETRLRSELAGLGTGQTGFTADDFWNNKHRGNHGHWYWLRHAPFYMEKGGSNVPRKAIGSNSGNFNFRKKTAADDWQVEEDPDFVPWK